MKFRRYKILTGIFLGALLLIVGILIFPKTQNQSYKSLNSRVLEKAQQVSTDLGHFKASLNFSKLHAKSRMSDLDAAVEKGLVSRLSFTPTGAADYLGIIFNLRQWASTNNAEILLTSVTTNGLIVYTPPADHGKITNYFATLTVDDWTPYE